MVIGTVTKRKCTARCWNAKSLSCRCSCGGENHGKGMAGLFGGKRPHVVDDGRERISKEEFYKNKERKYSRELDYGVHWRDGQSWPTYRVTWVEATGEVYAIANDEEMVEILGVVKESKTLDEIEKAGGGYNDLRIEKLLSGWANVCGQPNSLDWIRSKLL